tara:strand:+ start:330 stop:911 length:582 start_codon:yes stop_codon:yes gene_type:complete
MCDAEYINKKQLKLIKLEKLLKKWDKKHYNKTFSPYINEWNYECRDDNKEIYKSKILFMLGQGEGRQCGKKLIRKKLIKLFTNELNKLSAIRKSSDYGNWNCWLYENTGIFPYENIMEIGGYYTFTEMKKKLKEIIVNKVDKFMEKDHTTIADYLSSHYGSYIDIRFRIIYSVIKEEENDCDTEIKFTPDMFC